MAKTPRALLIVLLVLAAAPAWAARPPSFTADALSAQIKALDLDSFQGRPSFGRGQDKTTDAIIFTLRAYGLKPAGDPVGGSDDGEPRRAWTQAVPMVRYATVGPRAAVRLGGAETALQPGSQILLRTLQPVASVDLTDAPLVFVGYGIDDPSRGWDDFKGADLKGKVAVALSGDPETPAFGGTAMTWPGRWTAKIEAAAKHGASGLLIIHDPVRAGASWASLSASFAATQYGLSEDAADDPLVEGWLSAETAAAMLTKAGQSLPALSAAAASASFRPVSLGDAAFSAQYGVSHSPATTYNVVVRLKGETRPDQSLLITSHWDGPGAVGSTGAAALLELARAFGAAGPNARSVVFLLAGGAQQGDLGAQYYAEHPSYPLGQTVAAVGLGPFDADGPARDMTLWGNSSTDLSVRLADVLRASSRALTPDPNQTDGHAYRTDAFAFAKAGVPSVELGSGANLLRGGTSAGTAWRAAYMTERYGKAGDAWSKDLRLDGLAADLADLFTFTRNLANQADWPATGPEFSAARKASAGDRR